MYRALELGDAGILPGIVPHEGSVVSTGAAYTNRYISVLTITDRKVTHWRDYLDPVAVFDAFGWPSR